jgi:hypothetical protein
MHVLHGSMPVTAAIESVLTLDATRSATPAVASTTYNLLEQVAILAQPLVCAKPTKYGGLLLQL